MLSIGAGSGAWRRSGAVSRQAAALTLLVGCAFGAGAASVLHARLLLLGVVGLGLLCLLVAPNVAALLAVATLPFPLTLAPGLPLELAASDLLTVVALVGWALRGALRPTSGPRLRPLAPLALVLAGYGLAMLISLAVHPSGVGVATVLQRLELVVGAILVGAGLVRAGLLRPALEAYLVTASTLALGALRYSGSEAILGVQKNPAAGFIAAALFIAIILRPSRRWMLYAPVLALGLLATQSRGALVGAIVAAVVCVLLVRLRERVRLLAAFLTAGALLFLGYLNLPDAARRRLENLSGASDYAIRYRADFQADALDAFHSSPWFGVGVGNYKGGPRQPGIVDPHQIQADRLVVQVSQGELRCRPRVRGPGLQRLHPQQHLAVTPQQGLAEHAQRNDRRGEDREGHADANLPRAVLAEGAGDRRDGPGLRKHQDRQHQQHRVAGHGRPPGWPGAELAEAVTVRRSAAGQVERHGRGERQQQQRQTCCAHRRRRVGAQHEHRTGQLDDRQSRRHRGHERGGHPKVSHRRAGTSMVAQLGHGGDQKHRGEGKSGRQVKQSHVGKCAPLEGRTSAPSPRRARRNA